MRERVIRLQHELAEALRELFCSRLHRMVDTTPCTNVYFNIVDSNNWQIQYCAYNTTITFGKKNTYFIKGGRELCVYRNSAGVIRVKDPHDTSSIESQINNILAYSYLEVPEYLAIRFFQYMNDNAWDDNSIVVHYSIV